MTKFKTFFVTFRKDHHHSDRGYDNRHEEQSRSSQFSPRGRGSPKRGRGRGWGDHNRKRPADSRDYGHEAKRQFTEGKCSS